MTDLRVDLLNKDMPLAADLLPVIADADGAIATMAREEDRRTKAEQLDQIRQGASHMLVVRDGGRPICFIAFRPNDKEAVLRLGHILPGFTHKSESILELFIKALTSNGFSSITSVFNWPQQEVFMEAAEAIGFARVDRMNMMRKPEASIIRPSLPEGIKILPWSARCSSASAQILFENAFSGDKAFHKPYRTLEGCRGYLNAVLSGRYGRFLHELSFIACHDRRQVGLLLASRLPRTGIDIVDLAVEEEYRGRGIAGSLIASLIEANAIAPREEITLTVTKSNLTASGLYRHMGFEVTDDVSYYLYDADVQG